MIVGITEKEYAVVILLRQVGTDVLETAILAKEAIKNGRGHIERARKCLEAGRRELQRRERTVTLEKAVEKALQVRQELRPRTLIDFRYFARRLMRLNPGAARRRVRGIDANECSIWLEKAFSSLHQRRKARAILSGVFSTAIREGWCDTNPITKVNTPQVKEKQLPILTPSEITKLTTTAEQYANGSCAAAVGMMLYAGIRPHEVARLSWAQVDLQAEAIYILPQHSKTGGARRGTIHAPLLDILKRHQQADASRICPPNWLMHWRTLRQQAGWGTDSHPWRQDVLRHTYASYHLSRFRSYTELQCEIGHRDASLLRTRI